MKLYNQYCSPPFEQLTEVWKKPYILKFWENSKNQVNIPGLAEFKVFKIILLKKTNAKTLFMCTLIKKFWLYNTASLTWRACLRNVLFSCMAHSMHSLHSSTLEKLCKIALFQHQLLKPFVQIDVFYGC